MAGRPAGDEPGAQGDARRQRDQLHRQEPRELQLRAGQEEAEQDRGAIHHRRANVHRVMNQEMTKSEIVHEKVKCLLPRAKS